MRTEYLSKEQLASLFHVLENEPNRMIANMMLLAFYTGMRKGKIYRLKWEHVDFERGFILRNDPKGKAGQRIYINSAARKLFDIKCIQRANMYVTAETKGDYVKYILLGEFVGQRGSHILFDLRMAFDMCLHLFSQVRAMWICLRFRNCLHTKLFQWYSGMLT